MRAYATLQSWKQTLLQASRKHRSSLAKIGLLGMLFAFVFGTSIAQNGTSHGVLVSWTPSTQVAGETVQSFNVYRCLGGSASCSLSIGVWAKIGSVGASLSNYTDPSAGLTPGSSYSYVATAIDSDNDESIFSNISVVQIPATGFPANPAAPSGCNTKVQ